jgi:hypothetical protein
MAFYRPLERLNHYIVIPDSLSYRAAIRPKVYNSGQLVLSLAYHDEFQFNPIKNMISQEAGVQRSGDSQIHISSE